MHTIERTLVAALAAAFLAIPCRARIEVDPRPAYRTVQGISGSVRSVGSDTAPPSLIAGTANFGPMSRPMKDSESDGFEKRFGYKPTAVRAAIDMVAVYVHRDNPVERRGLTLREIDAMFFSTRTGGLKSDLTSWGDVEYEGSWSPLPISLYGRNSASGTNGFFKEKALFKGDFKSSVKEQPGSSSVVQGVASDRAGVGYSGIGYQTADVAAVPISATLGGKPVVPAPANVSDYPLARFLLVYVNKEPGRDLDPLRREFLKLIFSREGQEAVIKDGYLPVSYEIAKSTLAEVGIDIERDHL